MILGTTSFALRYRFLDAATAPPLESQFEPLRRLGVEALQICENVRPLQIGDQRWCAMVKQAAALDLRLSLGCMTMNCETIASHIERAAGIPSKTVRVVFEVDRGSNAEPTRAQVARLLDQVTPLLESLDMRLAIENHFDLPSRVLADVAAGYPADRVGFCLDVANSLRKFEPPEFVFDLLEDRAFHYHFKDYRIEGSNVSFRVLGAPLGTGLLDLSGLLRRVLARTPEPEIYVENWVPSTGSALVDAETDTEWLAAGLLAIRNLRDNATVSAII